MAFYQDGVEQGWWLGVFVFEELKGSVEVLEGVGVVIDSDWDVAHVDQVLYVLGLD